MIDKVDSTEVYELLKENVWVNVNYFRFTHSLHHI